MRLLLALLLAIAFLSSEAAILWRFDLVRMLAFIGILGALLSLALVRDPRIAPREPTSLAILVLLLAVVLGTDVCQGDVDPLDYKVALLLPVLLLAPNLGHLFRDRDVPELIWRLLTGYVVATGLLAMAGAPSWLVRGQEDLARFDFTGSLIGHSGLCVIYLVATLARLGRGAGLSRLATHLPLAGLAAIMVLLTATRTALVTFVIYLLLEVASARGSRFAIARSCRLAGGALLVFALYTLLVSDDFMERLLGSGSPDWSSGRVASQLHWLSLELEHPLGLGFGAVRELLRGGRPALDGASLLEWPHNEPIRFFVESGLPGLAFVVLLLAMLTRKAIDSAREDPVPLRRAMIIAIAADMLAQSLFQNYFNSVYHSVAFLLVLVTLCAQARAQAEETTLQAGPSSAREDLSSGTAAA